MRMREMEEIKYYEKISTIEVPDHTAANLRVFVCKMLRAERITQDGPPKYAAAETTVLRIDQELKKGCKRKEWRRNKGRNKA
uniref:Uncharacterized protein n=1 Tax=Pristionchus pacificus TaxID=54126 RepID=A0A2A6CTR7_PRIPA|eukprot:PDM81500.1 hypothetical protein PRIPAC_35376 [Pristionchus pacificus]